MKELILIDAGAQEDLMIWDQLARSISELELQDRFLCLIVGSGEAADRALESAGFPVCRIDDELKVSPEAAIVLEKVLREEKRKISSRLTDEGVSAVGFIGMDRSFLRVTRKQIHVSDSLEKTLWQAPGVVPVLISAGTDDDGQVVDLHPARVAGAISSILSDKVSVTVLSQRVTEAMRQKNSGTVGTMLRQLVSEKAVSESWMRVPYEDNWVVSHASVYGR